MTAEAPATANVTLTNRVLPLARLNLSAPQRHLLQLLLIYRWISLTPLVWLWSDQNPLFLVFAAAAIGLTLLVTFSSQSQAINPALIEVIVFQAVDLACVAILLTLSGADQSPLYHFALTPLLLSVLLLHMRGVLVTAAAFTLFYALGLFFSADSPAISIQPGQLFSQFLGAWLIPVMVGYVVQKQQNPAHPEDLHRGDNGLSQRLVELTNAHNQLEIIHDATLQLQGISESRAVQQRVLRLVTGELGFNKAVIGLINPVTQRLGEWQTTPTPTDNQPAFDSLPLTPDSGLITRYLLDRRVGWWFNEEPLVADEPFNDWLSQTPWLILPLTCAERAVGVLLVAVSSGPGSLSEDQLVILSAVTSQAAAALGAIERTHHLAVEQERNRIARDIHDTVAQSLFGIVFTLDACIKMLPQQSETVRQELIELRAVADQTRQEVRRSILDTWPSALTQEQFKIDINKYVAHCSPAHAFYLDVTINGDFDRLPAAIRRGLYRISQEALANTARHAGVDTARLTMHVEPDQVYLSITDRGKGFEPKVALAREYNRDHFGLQGICERTAALGGACNILSKVGFGTQVLVRVPIQHKE